MITNGKQFRISLCTSWAIAAIAQEVTAKTQHIPKNIQQTLSPEFVGEWDPAVDNEKKGFDCFTAVYIPSGVRPLPGLWVFTRKLDGYPKALFLFSLATFQFLLRIFSDQTSLV